MSQITVQTIADRAVLMKFTKGAFSQYKKDKAVTKEVEVAKGVKGAGNYNKKLLSECQEYDEAVQAYSAAYMYYINNTSPWLDEDGIRVLRNDRIMEVSQEIGNLIREADKAADRLEANWPAIVARDIARLASLGNPDDYPASVRDRFYASYIFRPIPVDSDFRATIPQYELDKMNAQLADAEKVAVTHAVSVVMEPLKAAAVRLGEYKGEKGERFREAILLNIQQATKQAKVLNVMDDTALNELLADIDTMMAPYYLAPQQVKEDESVRDNAKQKVEAIMAKMGGMYG